MLHFSVCNCVRSWSQPPGLYWLGCDGFVLNEIDTPEKPNKVNFPQRTGQAHVGQNCFVPPELRCNPRWRKKLLFKGTVAFLTGKNRKWTSTCTYIVPPHPKKSNCSMEASRWCLHLAFFVGVTSRWGKWPDFSIWAELTWFGFSGVLASSKVNSAHPYVQSPSAQFQFQLKLLVENFTTEHLIVFLLFLNILKCFSSFDFLSLLCFS